LNLGMTQWAMLKSQVVKLLIECLMFADFASVVFLLKDGCSTGNASRVVTSTFLTVSVAKV
jgi:hypothetical protein